MKKKLLIVLAILVLASGYFAYKKVIMSSDSAAIRAMPVDVQIVHESDFSPAVSFVSKIEAKNKVAVRARVAGFLMKRLFTEGDFVNEGQVLFEIEKDQFEANVRKMQANLAKASAAEENAAAQYKRAKDLFKTKDVSEARLDERSAESSTASANVKQAQSDLDLAQLDLDYTDIKAPIEGRIGESVYSVGSYIGPESGELATIVSTTPMYAVFSVSENQLLQIREFLNGGGNSDDNVIITFKYANGNEYPVKGHMNFVDIALDEQMNTLKIRVSFDNPENRLIAGQYGRVEMQFKKPRRAILIPQIILQRDLAGAFVYVVNNENVIEMRRVTEGLELTNGNIVIDKGLIVGEKIIVNNFQKIMPGMTVAPVEAVPVEN